ncbi:MAG: Holliday junction resolvase RuvX [Firmicutes bacterium]|nr:Holliday junction resolvase RuvX [Bacillota bacterium]
MRILGLDVGSKTIGIAVSDPLGFSAQGLTTVRRSSWQADLAAVCNYISEYEAKTIIIGLPLNMNGSLGPAATVAKLFAKKLEQAACAAGLDICVIMRDERLTTVAASRVLLQGDVSRQKRKKVIDKVAAVLILQGYLDYQLNLHNE